MEIIREIINTIRRSSAVKNKIKSNARLKRIIISVIGMRVEQGSQIQVKGKETILLISHEASATGAPILALNIGKRLSRKYNIITILLKGGCLKEKFKDHSTKVISFKLGIVNQIGLKREIKRIQEEASMPSFAIINSIVSAQTIEPIRKLGIPTLTLIHEFSAYIRPLSMLDNVGLYSSDIIFSSKMTRDDLLQKCPQLKSVMTGVLQQRNCEKINSTKNVSE